MSIEAINQHIQLNEKLNKYGLSTKDVHRLINLLLTAKEYRYNPRKIIGKLRNIKSLENKENRLKNSCEIRSKQLKEYNKVLPLAQKIVGMNIDIRELLALDAEVNKIAREHNIPPYVAVFLLFNEIREYNKIGGLKKEVSRLCQQIFVIKGLCANQNEVMMTLVNLKSHGITEDNILYLNNLLENNGYNIDMISSISKHTRSST